MTKICKKCGLSKSIELFVKHTSTKDGYLSTCISCNQNKRRENRGILNPINIGNKVCPICNKDLPISKFRVYTKSKTGRYWMCEDCYSRHSKLNIDKDRNYFRKLRRKIVSSYRDELCLSHNLNRRKNFKNNMYRAARSRAMKKGIEFSIEIEDIIIPKICPLLKVHFVYGVKGNYSLTPSLDRIDNLKGYTKENIWVISQRANSMKNDASWEELYEFSTNIIRYSPTYIKKEDVESKNKES